MFQANTGCHKELNDTYNHIIIFNTGLFLSLVNAVNT